MICADFPDLYAHMYYMDGKGFPMACAVIGIDFGPETGLGRSLDTNEATASMFCIYPSMESIGTHTRQIMRRDICFTDKTRPWLIGRICGREIPLGFAWFHMALLFLKTPGLLIDLIESRRHPRLSIDPH